MTLRIIGISCLFFAALILTHPAPAQAVPGVHSTNPADLKPGHYVADEKHTSVIARATHMGFSHYPIRFGGIDAAFDYDPANPSATNITVTIRVDTLDTGSRTFNAELKGSGWFDAATWPEIRFVSTHVDPGDGRHGKMTGDLSLHGVTRPVTLDVTFNGAGSGLWPGEVRTGFSATAAIPRAAFGFTKIPQLVADEVTLEIEAEFTRK